MISAVNNQGLSFFCFQKKAVTRYSFIKFLHRLIKENVSAGRKLFEMRVRKMDLKVPPE